MVSHLGADRASAYPVLKAKGIAEESIRRCGIDYTILRSAILFGPGDFFTTLLACLASAQPIFFLLPGDGDTVLQPLWVEDLATGLAWALDDEGPATELNPVVLNISLSARRPKSSCGGMEWRLSPAGRLSCAA
jgi:uncharacterized protein YbjT (DUF2867 family)